MNTIFDTIFDTFVFAGVLAAIGTITFCAVYTIYMIIFHTEKEERF